MKPACETAAPVTAAPAPQSAKPVCENDPAAAQPVKPAVEAAAGKAAMAQAGAAQPVKPACETAAPVTAAPASQSVKPASENDPAAPQPAKTETPSAETLPVDTQPAADESLSTGTDAPAQGEKHED